MTGAVGNGEWTGVSLHDVLTLAGITDAAVSVLLIGQDTEAPEGGFRRVVPIEKAMHPDTLLAYALNGDTLPQDHATRYALFCPVGWVVRTSSGYAESSYRPSALDAQQYHVIRAYWRRISRRRRSTGRSSDCPEHQECACITMACRTARGLSSCTRLRALSFRKHHGSGLERRLRHHLESCDSARASSPVFMGALRITWIARPGDHTILTRATDVLGNTQPDDIPFNEKGYLFNQPVPHPVKVS